MLQPTPVKHNFNKEHKTHDCFILQITYNFPSFTEELGKLNCFTIVFLKIIETRETLATISKPKWLLFYRTIDTFLIKLYVPPAADRLHVTFPSIIAVVQS